MTPTKQTKLYSPDGHHSGNCWQAALASLLDLPLWMVPDFSEMFGRTTDHWFERTQEWLRRMFRVQIQRVDGHPVDELPEFYLAIGKSPRGVSHVVIYSRGQMVHDPHYSDAGVLAVDYCEYLESLPE